MLLRELTSSLATLVDEFSCYIYIAAYFTVKSIYLGHYLFALGIAQLEELLRIGALLSQVKISIHGDVILLRQDYSRYLLDLA